MQFLNPIWFFALAALTIPVVIHLWNIKPGRVLKVGSIALINEASRKSSRSFKLTDIPLLILRCLFLILLAFLLAAPWLQQHLKTKKSVGWVLLPQSDLNNAYPRYKKPIDSLLQKGYEFHFFNDSLPKADLVQLLKQKDTATKNIATKTPAAYWDLIKQLDTKVAADVPVYLYTSNAFKHFTGDKPQADLNLHWQTYAEADSSAQWLQNAWFNNDKTVRVVKGVSTPSGTGFEYTTLRNDNSNAHYNVQVQNGAATVNLARQNKGIAVDTAVLNIAVYTDHFGADAAYLKAALAAAGQFSQRRYLIHSYNNPLAIASGISWVFWLSEQVVPTKLLSQNVKILAYQNGKQNLVATNMAMGSNLSLPGGDEQTAIFKATASPGTADAIWHDGYGNALVSATKQNRATVYRFYSRFSPAYNDLVWRSSFPQMMLRLIFDTDVKEFSRFDKRTINVAQIMPAKTAEKNIIQEKFSFKKDLAIYFWLALVLIFIAERWLATSNKTVQA